MAPKKQQAENDAYKAIKQLFEENNRPFNAQTVIDNTGSKFTPTYAKKALDRLEQDGLVMSKEKKIYWPNQNLIAVLSDKELIAIKNENRDLEAEIEELSKQIDSVSSELSTLLSTPRTAEIEEKIAKLRHDIEQQEETLAEYKSNGDPVEESVKKQAELNYKLYLRTWRERRELCTTVLDSIEENSDKSKRDLYDEIGIETDSDAGSLSIKEYATTHPQWSKRK